MTSPLTLAVDVGGTGIKAAVFDSDGCLVGDPVRVRTPYPCSPQRLVDEIAELASTLAPAQRAGVGFPGLLRSNRVIWVNSLSRSTPAGPFDDGLAAQWVGCHLADTVSGSLGIPVRVANDADVHALASVSGRGLECVITLGTGLGFSLINDGELLPHLELSGAPFLEGRDYESVLGHAGLERDGIDRWTAHVVSAIDSLRRFLYFDHLYVGGGNARLLDPGTLGAHVSIVDNVNGILGGYLLWATNDKEVS
jgi:polyphosphate glucokinase